MSRIQGDMVIVGRLTPKYLDVPSQTIVDDDVSASAGIQAGKLQHQHQPAYAQKSDATAAAERRVVHVVRGATGTIESFEAGSVVVCTGDATITVDLLKNGVSVLTGPIVLDSTNTPRAPEGGTVDPAKKTLADGDVLEVDVDVDAGTGTLGEGVFAMPTIREDA